MQRPALAGFSFDSDKAYYFLVGSIYGAVLITLLPLFLRSGLDLIAPFPPGVVAQFAYFREFFFGLIIVLFLIFEPRGLAPIWVRTKSSPGRSKGTE